LARGRILEISRVWSRTNNCFHLTTCFQYELVILNTIAVDCCCQCVKKMQSALREDSIKTHCMPNFTKSYFYNDFGAKCGSQSNKLTYLLVKISTASWVHYQCISVCYKIVILTFIFYTLRRKYNQVCCVERLGCSTSHRHNYNTRWIFLKMWISITKRGGVIFNNKKYKSSF
jgi:hypothetical protein